MKLCADKKHWACPADLNRCIWRSRRLVGILRPVVQVTVLPVLDREQNTALCRAVAPQLVGHNVTNDAYGYTRPFPNRAQRRFELRQTRSASFAFPGAKRSMDFDVPHRWQRLAKRSTDPLLGAAA
jgi:hypothetical protein